MTPYQPIVEDRLNKVHVVKCHCGRLYNDQIKEWLPSKPTKEALDALDRSVEYGVMSIQIKKCVYCKDEEGA